jgi:RHS repeat-associated protein
VKSAPLNLLTHVVNPGGTYSTASSPVYDPLGRLYQTGSNFDGNQAETVEDLAGQVVFEYATRGRARRYVFGPEPDELLIQYFTYAPAPQYNSRTWYQNDERGSIASLTGDAGNGGTPNRYDEYGVPAASNFGRYQYTGQFWLAEPSLYYYKARFYDPKLGLFLQTDPKGYEAGVNLYAYVGDDPITKTDPTGTDGVAAAYCSACHRSTGELRPPNTSLPKIPPNLVIGAVAVAACVTSISNCANGLTQIVQNALFNESKEPFSTDNTGKINEDELNADDIGDTEIDEAIAQLDRSIGRRQLEDSRYPRGNPNGSPRERADYARHKGHQERISRETRVRNELEARKKAKDDDK